jgi:hypothetical protein
MHLELKFGNLAFRNLVMKKCNFILILLMIKEDGENGASWLQDIRCELQI